MSERKRRVYWVRRLKEKDLLVFDGGYFGGDVHIYEFKESHSAKDIEEELKNRYKVATLPDVMTDESVNLWVEKKFGMPVTYDLKP